MTSASEQLRAAARNLTHPVDNETLAAAVTAERFGASTREGDWSRLYVLLHSIMAFFKANPHLPLPHHLTLHGRVVTMDELERIAVAHDTYLYPAESPRQMDLTFSEPPTQVSYLVRLAHEHESERPL